MREAAPATSLAAYRDGSLRAPPTLEPYGNDSASPMLTASVSAAAAAAPLPRALTLHEDALMRFACSGRWNELRAALNDAGARDIDVNFRFPHNLATLLHYAAAASDAAETHCADAKSVDAAAALDDAADDDSTVAFLLGRGADPNAIAANGSTPLHWAAGGGNERACRLLLARGAAPGARSHTWTRSVFGRASGQTALHWAAESAHERCVALLAERAPLLAAETDERRRSPREVGEGGASAHTPGGKSCLALLQAAEDEPFVAIEVSRMWSATAPI
jgi:hypothetical protein